MTISVNNYNVLMQGHEMLHVLNKVYVLSFKLRYFQGINSPQLQRGSSHLTLLKDSNGYIYHQI
jgi:hypothetical protein